MSVETAEQAEEFASEVAQFLSDLSLRIRHMLEVCQEVFESRGVDLEHDLWWFAGIDCLDHYARWSLDVLSVEVVLTYTDEEGDSYKLSFSYSELYNEPAYRARAHEFVDNYLKRNQTNEV